MIPSRIYKQTADGHYIISRIYCEHRDAPKEKPKEKPKYITEKEEKSNSKELDSSNQVDMEFLSNLLKGS
jgi:hypothetical protein